MARALLIVSSKNKKFEWISRAKADLVSPTELIKQRGDKASCKKDKGKALINQFPPSSSSAQPRF